MMPSLAKLIPLRRRVPVVSVLRLAGVIGDHGPLQRGLSLRRITRQLDAAFAGRRTRAVALLINSPGGSPVQSDLIQQRIRNLAREKEKPVFAFCEDVAASGGYWIALGASEIHANANSIIGSIGVISAGFGFDKAIDRLGIERRVHVTGPRKGMLDPFRTEDPDDVAHLRQIQTEMFQRFCDHVRSRRGVKLKGDEDELFSGAFWTGEKALKLGLIDGLGDMYSVLRERYGEKLRFRTVSPRQGLLRRLGNGISGAPPDPFDPALAADWAEPLLAGLEARAHWHRFGL